jgi:hypothetical protein
MWIEACFNFERLSCIELQVPNVEFQKMPSGLYGYYDGGRTVYVNKKLKGDKRRATLHHEFIHYIQKYRGGLIVPGPAEQICRAEEEAFALTDAWWERIGRPNMKRGPKWWKPYTHCYKWYADAKARRGWWGFVGG